MSLATLPPRWTTAYLLAITLVVSACSKGEVGAVPAAGTNTGAVVPEAAAATLPPPPPPDAPPPPPTEGAAAWTSAALDEMLAPIALYPDPILAQVLAASTNAQEMLDAGNWLLQNPNLNDEALTKAAAEAAFSPSVQALIHFPTVVDMMCRELDWTKQVGDAFTADQGAVLASVQRLRKQAADAGNLQSSPQMTVETTEQQGKEVIVLQPADPKVIYVPQYNPTQVYVPAPSTTTVVTTSPGITTEQAVVGGLLAFTAGVLVANAFNNNNDDYGYPNWGYGGVYYGPRPYYPHNTFIYAPHYPGYRPAYGYRPPVNYPAHYNNYQRNTVNNINVNNVNINNANNNYFNRFDKNQNRVSSYQPKSPVTRSVTATPATNWKGNSTYAGSANTQRPGNAAAATSRPVSRQPTGQPIPTGQYAGARPGTAQSGGVAQRPTTLPDRGYPQTSGERRDMPSTSNRGAEFRGAGTQQGSRDRAASQRGRTSMSGAPRPSSQPASRQSHRSASRPSGQRASQRSR